jgi:predicted dehydrogenase
MAVYAMEAGKHAAVEVPAAKTLEECWQLVETSERTKKHCMMLENCCYDFFELMTLNMKRDGFFGEIIHTEGAYIHDLLWLNFMKERRWDIRTCGGLKKTSEMETLCHHMDLGLFVRLWISIGGSDGLFDFSFKFNDFHMADKARELAEKDDFFAPFAEKNLEEI